MILVWWSSPRSTPESMSFWYCCRGVRVSEVQRWEDWIWSTWNKMAYHSEKDFCLGNDWTAYFQIHSKGYSRHCWGQSWQPRMSWVRVREAWSSNESSMGLRPTIYRRIDLSTETDDDVIDQEKPGSCVVFSLLGGINNRTRNRAFGSSYRTWAQR